MPRNDYGWIGEPGMNHATVSTIAGDLGNTVIFPALAAGGCLHVVSQACAESQAMLSDYLGRERIDWTARSACAGFRRAFPTRLRPRRRQ